MADELMHPPYPSESATADRIYAHLAELRDWVAAGRDEANASVGHDVVPKARGLPRRESYVTQPVLEQFRHYMVLRVIREQWDRLVRDFADCWGSKSAIAGRAMIMQTACVVLGEAFVPREVREAASVKYMEGIQRAFVEFGRQFDAACAASSWAKGGGAP